MYRRKVEVERWWVQGWPVELEHWVMGRAKLPARVLKKRVLKKRAQKERAPWIEMEWKQEQVLM